jgi:hypothetical protein
MRLRALCRRATTVVAAAAATSCSESDRSICWVESLRSRGSRASKSPWSRGSLWSQVNQHARAAEGDSSRRLMQVKPTRRASGQGAHSGGNELRVHPSFFRRRGPPRFDPSYTKWRYRKASERGLVETHLHVRKVRGYLLSHLTRSLARARHPCGGLLARTRGKCKLSDT